VKEEGLIETNPAKRILVKGETHTIVHNALSPQELNQLYQSYRNYLESAGKATTFSGIRDMVIVGLLLFQGVHKGELEKMQTGHVKLDAGTIHIPKTSRSNGRSLALNTVQIITLHQYIAQLPKNQTLLLTCSMHNKLFQLSAELKALYPAMKNLRHIRASVIMNWIKQYDKRQVQYLIGHKWISSTESYEIQDIEELSQLLKQYHPFG
jgi:integrase/recombinase XerD